MLQVDELRLVRKILFIRFLFHLGIHDMRRLAKLSNSTYMYINSFLLHIFKRLLVPKNDYVTICLLISLYSYYTRYYLVIALQIMTEYIVSGTT